MSFTKGVVLSPEIRHNKEYSDPNSSVARPNPMPPRKVIMERVHLRSISQRNTIRAAVFLCLSLVLALFWSGVNAVSASPVLQEPGTGVEAGGIPTTTAPPYSRRQAFTVQDPNAYVHTVRPGESWIAISQQYGIEYPELREANPELWSLRYTVIRPGDQMVIPTLGAGEMPTALDYTVQYRDSWYKIAESFGINYWDLRLDNITLWHKRGIYIRPGDTLIIRGATQNFESAQPRLEAVTEEALETTDGEGAETDVEEAPAAEAPAVVEAPATDNSAALPSAGTGGPYLAGQLPQGTALYVIRPGDTWFAIAAANGISFTDLRVLNQGLWDARGQSIRVGDQMIIPANAEPIPPDIRTVPQETPAATEEAPAEGETPAEATPPAEPEPVDEATPPAEGEGEAAPAEAEAEVDGNVEVDSSEERGPMQPTDPDTTRLRIEVAPPTILYIVQTGEDWSVVAAKAGVSVVELQSANPSLSGRELQPGDAVRFP